MNKNDLLINKLEEILNQTKLSGIASINAETKNKLVNIVLVDQRFPGNKVLGINSGSGIQGFYPNYFVDLLIEKLVETRSPNKTLKWFLKVLEAEYFDGQHIVALHNAPVKEKIDISDDVSIVPFDNLWDSPQKNRVIARANGFSNHTLSFNCPKSALIINKRIQPFLIPLGDHNRFTSFCSNEEVNAEGEKIHELVSDITLVLTIIGPRVPIQDFRWFTFIDLDLQWILNRGCLGSSPNLEITPLGSENHSLLDPTEVQETTGLFLRLEGKTKAKLRLALQRLHQAQLRRDPGDSAVELSIAFEILVGDDAKTEMTHKVTVRSARVLGGSAENRYKNSQLVKRIYSIRSKLVHSGKVVVDEKTRKDVMEGIVFCSDLIKSIIRRGSIPNWQEFDINEHY